MIKRFRHKLRGTIVKQHDDITELPDYIPNEGLPYFYLPYWVVEGSPDWEQLAEPLFVTYDGVSIYDENTLLYSLYKNSYSKTESSLASIRRAHNLTNDSYWYFFSSSEARQKFIEGEQNKKTLTIGEVRKYLNDKQTYLYKDQLLANLIEIAK